MSDGSRSFSLKTQLSHPPFTSHFPQVAALLASLQPRQGGGGEGPGRRATSSSASKLPWGGAALPRSARRRATSHTPKRWRRKRAAAAAAAVKKLDGKKKKFKRRKTATTKAQVPEAGAKEVRDASLLHLPRSGSAKKKLSRRARRKPRRLLEQIALSASASSSTPSLPSSRPPPPLLRLETHLWHAKRMAMGAPWASAAASKALVVALGAAGAGRGDRAVASAVRGRALAHDASYWKALRLRGGEEGILRVLDATAPGWRSRDDDEEEEKASSGDGKSSSSKRRSKRRRWRRGFSAAVLAGRAEADAVLASVPCPVRIMFDGVFVESVEGEEASRRPGARACLVWVHAAAEAEARAALLSAAAAAAESAVSLDLLPAPFRRLEVVGALADAVVVGAIGAAAVTRAAAKTADEPTDSRDGRAWAALRAGLRGGGSGGGGGGGKRNEGFPLSSRAVSPSSRNNAFSSLPSGCALRIVASDPRLSRAPREARAVVGGGAQRVAAAARAALGGRKEERKGEEPPPGRKQQQQQKQAPPPPPPGRRALVRPKAKRAAVYLASARVAACLSARRRRKEERKNTGDDNDDDNAGDVDKLFASSSPPPLPLPTRAVSAVRSAARRAALGLLPLPRRTAREVERWCHSSSSSGGRFSTTFPIAAVRRFPPPPRPRNSSSSPAAAHPPLRLPHWSIVVPAGWALPVWRALVECKRGGAGVGGSGSGSGRGSRGGGKAGKRRGGSARAPRRPLRGNGVAVAGQREWRWASSIFWNASNPCMSPFYPDDWAEGEVAKEARREEEAGAAREDAKRPPGRRKRAAAGRRGAKGEAGDDPRSSPFRVARTWQQVREALLRGRGERGEAAASEEAGDFVPAALWPERRGTLAAGSRVFLLRPCPPSVSSSSSSSPPPPPPPLPPSSSPSSPSSPSSSRGECLGFITSTPPRGCPPGVAASAGLLRARGLWGARFGKEREEERREERKKKESKRERKKKKGPSSSASVRVVVVLPDGREVVARAAPSDVAASFW